VAVLTGCGNSSAAPSKAVIVESGQVPRVDLPNIGKAGGAGLGSSLTTVPLAKQNPTTALFTAIGVFQSCLSGLGVTFIGAPSASDPNSPANSPAYLKSLTTCAAKSDIVQALKAAQSAQDNLTLAQIKTENKDYLKWRTCMIARGWGIPEPRPNSKGLLFSFGGTGGAPQFKPPPGQSLLSSSDVQECASKAQQGGS
jgi:hypothetical protein